MSGLRYTYHLQSPEKRKSNQYTMEDLENLTTLQLREICQKEKIVIGVAYKLDRAHMIEKILKYRGKKDLKWIEKFHSDAFRRVQLKISNNLIFEEADDIQIPNTITIYKNINMDLLDEVFIFGDFLKETVALLLNDQLQICGILNVKKQKDMFCLTYKHPLISQEIAARSYQNYSIGFLSERDSEYLCRFYEGEASLRLAKLRCKVKKIPVLHVQEAIETERILVIDFGSSFSSVGVYNPEKNDLQFKQEQEIPVSKIQFEKDESTFAFSYLVPVAVEIADCSDPFQIDCRFGYQAVTSFYKHSFYNKSTYFFYMKKWVNDYHKEEEISDKNGNVSKISRKTLLRSYFLYLIQQAEQQHKCLYQTIAITFPIKQKSQFLHMYKEILPDYHIEEAFGLDESSAVMYPLIKRQILSRNFVSDKRYKALIFHCGSNIVDLTSCEFQMNDNQITHEIDWRIEYLNEEVCFGGNAITYRIFQYIKILLGSYYSNHRILKIDDLLEITNIYRNVDENGVEQVYEKLEEKYQSYETMIPTKYHLFEQEEAEDYQKIRYNFYFLWYLAEQIKIYFYEHETAYQLDFKRLPVYQTPTNKILGEKGWKLNVLEQGSLTLKSQFPDCLITRSELDYLLQADIYYMVKKFIEPMFYSGELDAFHYIKLTGQSCKIPLFKEALKEFVPGKMISSAKKIKNKETFAFDCLEGAAHFHQDQKAGQVAPTFQFSISFIPYRLIGYTHTGEEKQFILNRSSNHRIYGFISKHAQTKFISIYLKNQENRLLHVYEIVVELADFALSNYEQLYEKYSGIILQDDIDNILDDEMKLFVFTEENMWGFCTVPIARVQGELFLGEQMYFSFEDKEWGDHFFDGLK